MRRLATATLCVFGLLLTGCGFEPVQRQPESADDGLQVTGRVDGRSVNVSVGEPDVVLGPCHPLRPDRDELCIDTRTVDGQPFSLVVINPTDLVAGEELAVRARCPQAGCDGVALVEVHLGGERIRVDDGSLAVRAVGPRYAARFTLRISSGTLTGAFDVAPAAG